MIYCDIDGVLLDTKAETFRCYKMSLETIVGYTLTEEVFNRCIWGKPWKEVISYWSPTGADSYKMEDVHREKNRLFDPTRCPVSHAAVTLMKNVCISDIRFVTAGSLVATQKKFSTCLNLFLGLRLLTDHNKCDGKWLSTLSPRNDLIFDDDIRVIEAAKRHGIATLHWTEFLCTTITY